jgi:hypothetical protein
VAIADGWQEKTSRSITDPVGVAAGGRGLPLCILASLHPCNLEVFSTGISGLLGGEKLKDADATGIQLSSI